jgi:hypothetical protein
VRNHCRVFKLEWAAAPWFAKIKSAKHFCIYPAVDFRPCSSTSYKRVESKRVKLSQRLALALALSHTRPFHTLVAAKHPHFHTLCYASFSPTMSARANANDISMETISHGTVTNQPRRQHGMQKSFAAGTSTHSQCISLHSFFSLPSLSLTVRKSFRVGGLFSLSTTF